MSRWQSGEHVRSVRIECTDRQMANRMLRLELDPQHSDAALAGLDDDLSKVERAHSSDNEGLILVIKKSRCQRGERRRFEPRSDGQHQAARKR